MKFESPEEFRKHLERIDKMMGWPEKIEVKSDEEERVFEVVEEENY